MPFQHTPFEFDNHISSSMCLAIFIIIIINRLGEFFRDFRFNICCTSFLAVKMTKMYRLLSLLFVIICLLYIQFPR